jgi:adenylate kinase family enzyme
MPASDLRRVLEWLRLGAGLAVDDLLPYRARQVLISGTSGAGETRLAGRVAGILRLPHIEIDALFHGPDWMPRVSFIEDVLEFSARPEWVTEWQYSQVREVLVQRADIMIWLDLPRSLRSSHQRYRSSELCSAERLGVAAEQR